MYINTAEANSLTQIFVSQRLPKSQAAALVKQLSHWESHHGIRWVVDRLKAMKASLLSGETTGIRTHKDGTFFGTFRPVSRLSKKGRRGAIRADRILRVYGRWEAERPSSDDFHQFADGVAFDGYHYDGPSFLLSKSDIRLGCKAQRNARFDKSLPNSDRKVVPFTSEVEADLTPQDHFEVLRNLCPQIMLRHYAHINEHVFPYNPMDTHAAPNRHIPFKVELDLVNPERRVDVVGKIACLTKDRGLKRRFIANPHRLLQVATSRLQDACAQYLRARPESFVYDQDRAVDWVQSQLKQGKMLWSLDLSSATDHFPLAPQVELLNKLFPGLHSDIRLWEDVCQSNWHTPHTDVVVKYGKGQPMGTSPSFAAFTISHIHMCITCGGHSGNFRVIGDDIVISDPGVAKRYQEMMRTLGVAISSAKSLFGDLKAEFAGRIIDIHGLWPVYKASPLDIKSDPLGMLRQYGMAGLSLVPTSLQPLIGFVGRMPLIGPPHTQDLRVLNEIPDDVDLHAVYAEAFEPYTHEGVRPLKSAFLKPPTHVEGMAPIWGEPIISTPVSLNDRRLVEHVNANLADHHESDVLNQWKSMLHLGSSGPDGWEESTTKFPISYCKKVYKLCTSGTLSE